MYGEHAAYSKYVSRELSCKLLHKNSDKTQRQYLYWCLLLRQQES